MSVWHKVSEELPPLDEDVLILFKDKSEKAIEDNLFYAISHRYIFDPFQTGKSATQRWSYYTEYQGYYEVMYWTPLVDMPISLMREDNKK